MKRLRLAEMNGEAEAGQLGAGVGGEGLVTGNLASVGKHCLLLEELHLSNTKCVGKLEVLHSGGGGGCAAVVMTMWR